jgi:hypothetical protein
MECKVLECVCRGNSACKYQDEKYGEQMRVHSRMGETKSYRCSVCSREVTKGENSSGKPEKGKKK